MNKLKQVLLFPLKAIQTVLVGIVVLIFALLWHHNDPEE